MGVIVFFLFMLLARQFIYIFTKKLNEYYNKQSFWIFKRKYREPAPDVKRKIRTRNAVKTFAVVISLIAGIGFVFYLILKGLGFLEL